MAECFNRQVLRDLLSRWSSNEMTDQDLQWEAERLWQQYGIWIKSGPEDPRSITRQALDCLRLRSDDPICRSDVPMLLEFLNTPKGKEERGWEKWREYWSRQERKDRGMMQ